ncbi:MAG: glycosyltransferase [Candidatus Gastranaerophilales bacterium]|nr:glycosyltransferase [Candidatus Gastranaerophilales bacterium]
MNILFLHRSFPAQFKHIATTLAQDPSNLVMFITNTENGQIHGVNKLVYKPKREVSKGCDPYLQVYEETVIHGEAAANIAKVMTQCGIKPDIIYGFSWGPPMFIKELFPDTPLICYFEWFGKSENSVFDFGGVNLTQSQKESIKCNNSHVLLDLCNCDAGITPTYWQRDQFPKEFHHKIKVLHDGIDTDVCKPDNNVKIFIEGSNLELNSGDEIITYATRGMEPYRGFPQFMEAVSILLKKRPNAKFIIAGADAVCYSPKLAQGTYKELMLKKFDIDLNRVLFVGSLPFEHYLKVLQISSVHVYLTYPFILSWSVLEAMSAGCCVVASDTKPVTEVIKDNYNGLLTDFFNVEQLVEKIEYALDNQAKMKEIRANARKTIAENYALKDILPKHIEYIKSLIK